MKRIVFVFVLMIALVSCKTEKKNHKILNEQEIMETKKVQVIGNKFKVDFGGDFVFELNFQAENKMTWTPLKGDDRQSHTEEITMIEIRPNVYMVYWKEESGNRIVHIEDFEKELAYTNIAMSDTDETFYHFNGPLTLIK